MGWSSGYTDAGGQRRGSGVTRQVEDTRQSMHAHIHNSTATNVHARIHTQTQSHTHAHTPTSECAHPRHSASKTIAAWCVREHCGWGRTRRTIRDRKCAPLSANPTYERRAGKVCRQPWGVSPSPQASEARGFATTHPQRRRGDLPETTKKKKHFLIKITYESFAATVDADRVRWVYEWGGCEARKEELRD